MKTCSPLRALRTFLAALLCLSTLSVLPASAAEPVILFDEGHGQRFTTQGAGELDLSILAGLISKKGADVRQLKEKIGPGTLADAQALIISGPFAPYDADEVAALKAFLDGGGRLSVMLHIGQPVTTLFEALDIVFSRGVIHEHDGLINGKSQDFRVTRLEEHPVTKGIEEFAVYGGWAVKSKGPAAWNVAATGPRAWMDLDGSRTYTKGEPVEAFGMVVAGSYGKGSFIAFGDDAIFQNRFLSGGNRRLAENLAAWIVQ